MYSSLRGGIGREWDEGEDEEKHRRGEKEGGRAKKQSGVAFAKLC